MSGKRIAKKPIHVQLGEADAEQEIVFHQKDGDRFVKTVGELASSDSSEDASLSKLYPRSTRRWTQLLHEIVTTAAACTAWSRKHRLSRSAVRFSFSDGELLFLVVRKSKDYDEHLEDALSELEGALDLKTVHFSAMTLPPTVGKAADVTSF